MAGKRIVIATIGSFGDLFPCLAVAEELKKRGHHPMIAASPHYRERIIELGIDFAPMRPDLDALGDPALLTRRANHPRHGTEYVVRKIVMPSLRDSYRDLVTALKGADMLINHPLVYAGPILAEKTGLPWASFVLAPVSFLSVNEPPILPPAPWLGNIHRLSPALYRGLFALLRLGVGHWTRPVNQLRSELGLPPPERHPLFEGQFSQKLNLALFSATLARPQQDWPPNTVITGFPFFDDSGHDPSKLERLDTFLNSGSPPIAFVLGSTAVNDPGSFFRESISAARALGRRAVLVAGPAASALSEQTGADIAVFDYLPYASLFPHVAAVVHHGGIGTLAQAMRAGRPMIVVPFSHDQFDNGARAESLGIGYSLSRRRYRAKTVADRLAHLLTDPAIATNTRSLAARMVAEQGATGACDALLKSLP